MMNSYIGKVLSNFKDFYNDINAATLTGAIDVIVVEQPDGTFSCSPFHVRFGKLGVLRSKEKVVDVEVNGIPLDIHMKLGESGEAFFVEELEDSDDNNLPDHLATSPIPVVEIESMLKSGRRRSLDLTQIILEKVENEVNDYSKRRNTADDESTSKVRERNFFKRQITLGNIEVETSADDITSSLKTTKISSEDLSKDNDVSDTIFKMDSLETDLSKADSFNKIDDIKEDPKDEIMGNISSKNDDFSVNSESRGSKKKRRKTKRKNAPRKSSSANQLTVVTDNVEKIIDSATERSSLDSNSSEPELKELHSIQEPDEPSQNNSMSSAANSRKLLDPEFHFFSDTELTTGNIDSRSNTPIHLESVQSDSEIEVKNRKESDHKEHKQSWEWGGFPNVSQAVLSPTGTDSETAKVHEEQMSMLSTMFSFMKQNKRPINEGVYLSEISSGAIDPEVAAAYFSTSNIKKADTDMDCESGNGPSLIQSPNSAEGSKSIDSDFDEQNRDVNVFNGDIAISSCGWDPEPDEPRFLLHTITFTDLCNNPSLLEDNNIVIRIHNKYFTWKVASVMLASLLIYRTPLPQSTVEQLCNLHMPSTSKGLLESKGPQIDDKIKQEPGRYSWWSWRRSRRSTTPEVISDKDSTIVKVGDITERDIPKTKALSLDEVVSITSKDEDDLPSPSYPPSEKYRKTLRLSSKQISSLNLRDGMNEVEFSVTTAYQGTSRCKCHLYKWKWDDKIVISDIDGTITKSDVLGHILPIVGKDWAQSGVAQLFNKIKDNGYKLLYLSARAIGQARITREYLRSIKQGDLTMPDGPVLLNPTSLITAFHREVIEKKPEQFKISCMSDIKALFPADSNPFYAGYGNRINDVWAYRAVGIPIVRIFTINPKGELKHELTQTFQSSYKGQSLVVNDVFPPLCHKLYSESESDREVESSDDSEFELDDIQIQ